MNNGLRGIWVAVIIIATSLTTACDSSHDDRVNVPTSEPQVACSSVEGPRASRDAASAIAMAKAAWASTYEKNPSSLVYSPANVAKFEPYVATLKDDVWHVEGTVPPGHHGYVPVTSVCKNDEGVSTAWREAP